MRPHYLFWTPDLPPDQVFTPDDSGWEWGQPVDIAVVGQSPSTKRPFHRRHEVFGARSWALLKQVLANWVDEQGLTVLVTNLIRQPLEPRSSVPTALVSAWRPLLHETLQSFQPRRVLAVGAHAAKALVGERFHKLTEDHGSFFELELGPTATALVMPTFHFTVSFDDLTARRTLSADLARFDSLQASTTAPPYAMHEGALPEALMSDLRRRASSCILDIETTGLDPTSDQQMLFVGLRFNQQNHLVKDPTPEWLSRLGRLLLTRRSPIEVIGHNLYFDLYWLAYRGGLAWAQLPLISDTMLMALVAGESALALKHLTSLHTDLNGSHAFGGPNDPSYLAMDLLATEAVYDLMSARVRGSFIISVLNEAVPHLVEARLNGVKIQTERLEEIGSELDAQMEEMRARFEFNPSSDLQLSEWLLSRGCSTTLKTPKGKMSVSSEALEAFLTEGKAPPDVVETVTRVIEFRAMRKIASGFVTNYQRLMDDQGFLHPRLLLHGARTGRLSSSDPNVQQVPRRGPIKTLFISRFEGGLLGLVDLSQAELRCAALLANDPAMVESLLTADPHRHNAAKLYGKPLEEVTAVERKKSKAITFGLLYRGSPEGLASRTGFAVSEIRDALSLFNKAFPTLMAWLAKVEKEGTKTLMVKTLLGRTRELESVLATEGERGVLRKCANTHIQSLASDINLMIALRIMQGLRAKRLRSRFLFTVHDSLALDVHPEELEDVATLAQEAYRTFSIGTPLETLPLWGQLPIIGELIVGPTWASVESTNEHYGPVKTYPCSSAVAGEKEELFT